MALNPLSRKESPRDCDRQEVRLEFVEQKSASRERSPQWSEKPPAIFLEGEEGEIWCGGAEQPLLERHSGNSFWLAQSPPGHRPEPLPVQILALLVRGCCYLGENPRNWGSY